MDDARHVAAGKSRILVIGAGVAGLSAADHLLRNGFKNITVLEAMNRIGGRVLTSRFGKDGSDIVEQGANWIHGGSSSNSFFCLANQMGMLPGKLIPLDRMSGFCYRPDGVAIDKNLTTRVFEMFTKWEDEIPVFGDLSSRPTIDNHLRRRLKETLPDFEERQRDDVRCVFNCLVNYCQFHNAGFIQDHPIPDVVGYYDIPGGNVKVPCGMSSVIGGLVRHYPPSIIQLQKVVTMVNWVRNEVCVLCRDGSEYVADHVICTSSLGYLKRHANDMFNPSLPASKLNAIDVIPFGKVNKIFLQWERPFWKEGLGGIKLAWDNGSARINTMDEWYKKIFAFDEVLNNSNVLVGWISGREAEHMEILPESEVLQTCAAVIRKFLNDPSIPAPARILQTKWVTDPYVLGSYSYRNHLVNSHHINDLIEPVKQAESPSILFAGEATDPKGYSTLHGARNSGLREAERLIAYHGLAGKSNL